MRLRFHQVPPLATPILHVVLHCSLLVMLLSHANKTITVCEEKIYARCTSITWHISSTSRVQSLSLIASRNWQGVCWSQRIGFCRCFPLVTCDLHFQHVCTIFKLYSLEHWFEPAAIQLPLFSTMTDRQAKPSILKVLSTSFRVINRWARN